MRDNHIQAKIQRKALTAFHGGVAPPVGVAALAAATQFCHAGRSAMRRAEFCRLLAEMLLAIEASLPPRACSGGTTPG